MAEQDRILYTPPFPQFLASLMQKQAVAVATVFILSILCLMSLVLVLVSSRRLSATKTKAAIVCKLSRERQGYVCAWERWWWCVWGRGGGSAG